MVVGGSSVNTTNSTSFSIDLSPHLQQTEAPKDTLWWRSLRQDVRSQPVAADGAEIKLAWQKHKNLPPSHDACGSGFFFGEDATYLIGGGFGGSVSSYSVGEDTWQSDVGADIAGNPPTALAFCSSAQVGRSPVVTHHHHSELN